MPFVHNNHLYITYLVSPMHVVLRVPSPRLPVKVAFKTSSTAEMAGLPEGKIHGGPPVVLVPGRLSRWGGDYYLGVLHVRQTVPNVGITMPHYLYKTEAEPPFRITQVSKKALPMRTIEGRQPFAFASGMWLDEGKQRLLVSYGASDVASRVLLLGIAAMEEQYFGATPGS